MKKSTKFSDILHILLHMAQSKEPRTSETLAKAMQTNPVVVRRIMAALREKGFVISEKGHGGGWQLSCDVKKVSLYDIYTMIGSPAFFAMGNRTDSPLCRIESAVNKVTLSAFLEAENTLLKRFRHITLAELSSHRKSK
ncbi:MAG: Rrf2 family transcriptional regulator [Minisyncoccia bacterium]